MKTLYVVRHAKSSWEHDLLDDFERPLNIRGHRDAIRMGKLLEEQSICPELVISSPASRAAMTARLLCEQIKYPLTRIAFDPHLYLATPKALLKLIKSFKNDYRQIMLIGHNPGMTSLVNSLVQESITNLPTCAILGIKLAVESWIDLSGKCGTPIFYEYPRKHSDTSPE